MMLAKDDITKVKAITELTAEECLLNLKFEAEKAVINQRRQEIIEARSKRK
jgi:hypothetical protein